MPLAFTSAKAGPGVTPDGGRGPRSDGKAVGAQLADLMAGGRNLLIWTCAIVLEEVGPDTLIGVAAATTFRARGWQHAARQVVACGGAAVRRWRGDAQGQGDPSSCGR